MITYDLTDEQQAIYDDALEELTFFDDNRDVHKTSYKADVARLKAKYDNDPCILDYRLPKHPTDILHLLRQELLQSNVPVDMVDYIVDDLKDENSIARLQGTPRTTAILKEDVELQHQAEVLYDNLSKPRTAVDSIRENYVFTPRSVKQVLRHLR